MSRKRERVASTGGRRFWVAPALVGLVALAGVAPPEAGRSVVPPTGTATYVLVPDSSDNVRAAIDRTVAHMNFIVRPIARSRLTRVNPVPERVRVDVESDTVSVAFDNGNPVVTPRNGASALWRNPLTGEVDSARGTVAGDTVSQVIRAHDGERENALVFDSTGRELDLHVTVRSSRLPRPLEYALRFRKDTA